MASVGSSSPGLQSDETQDDAGWWVRMVYRLAAVLTEFQCRRQRRPYPSLLCLKLLRYAADRGHVQAMAQLGSLLYHHCIYRAEKRSGLEYLRQAAKRGDADSRYLLGLAYLDGRLARNDCKTALYWLALAAEQGHQDAACLLQQCQSRQSAVAIPEPATL